MVGEHVQRWCQLDHQGLADSHGFHGATAKCCIPMDPQAVASLRRSPPAPDLLDMATSIPDQTQRVRTAGPFASARLRTSALPSSRTLRSSLEILVELQQQRVQPGVMEQL
jgi:hypothetical protein